MSHSMVVGNGDTNNESETEMSSQSQDSDNAEGIGPPSGAEEVRRLDDTDEASESERSNGSITEGERFYTINEGPSGQDEEVPYNGHRLFG